MPENPIIVPLLITGVLIGYILRTKEARIGWRFTALGSLLGGLGNAVYAAALYLLPSQTTTETNIPSFVSRQTTLSQPPFLTTPSQTPALSLVFSFIVGIFIVLLVLIPAVLIQTRSKSEP